MDNCKRKLLAWSDSSEVSTGFGVVSRYVLNALYNTGLYDIEHLAINHTGKFQDRTLTPWDMLPAKLGNPEEPYGKSMFLKLLAEKTYDFVWIVNDTFVTSDIVDEMKKIFQERKNHNMPIPTIVYYYPVDCHVLKNACQMIEAADIAVAYTEYGYQETLKVLPNLAGKIKKIFHGTNTAVYRPLSQEGVVEAKVGCLKENADKFVILNVNRNSERKQLTKTLLAYAMFKKEVPNSILMLHTIPKDASFNRVGIDLFTAIQDLGLTLQDVLMPKYYTLTNGFPDPVMNSVYNAADVFLTTHLGEGWGLSISEAMAAGTPVVAPFNTNMPEMLGFYSERGYIYPCTDYCWIDNSGFRPVGATRDIVSKLREVYNSGNKLMNPKVQAAVQWTQQHTWDQAGQMWINLFEEAWKNKGTCQSSVSSEPEILIGDLL